MTSGNILRMGQIFLVRDEMEYTLKENLPVNKILTLLSKLLIIFFFFFFFFFTMWIMSVVVKISHIIFSFFCLVTSITWNQWIIHKFQNSFFWDFQRNQHYSCSHLDFFSPSRYLITAFGNLLIILAISSDTHIHTPTYFFLSNLSFADICFTSTTILKMLVNIQTRSKVILYEGCFT